MKKIAKPKKTWRVDDHYCQAHTKGEARAHFKLLDIDLTKRKIEDVERTVHAWMRREWPILQDKFGPEKGFDKLVYLTTDSGLSKETRERIARTVI